MPQRPTNPSPYLSVIDATEDNEFKALINDRDVITRYRIDILQDGNVINNDYKAEYSLPYPEYVSPSMRNQTINGVLKCGFTYQINTLGEMLIKGSGEFKFSDSSECEKTIQKYGVNTIYIEGNDHTSSIAIATNAFQNEGNIINIYLSDSVTLIQEEAFKHLGGLKNVRLGASTSTVFNRAFGGCNSLKEIILPDSVTNIGTEILIGCNSVMKITIPYIPSTEIKHTLFRRQDTLTYEYTGYSQSTADYYKVYEKSNEDIVYWIPKSFKSIIVANSNGNPLNISETCFCDMISLTNISIFGDEQASDSIDSKTFSGLRGWSWQIRENEGVVILGNDNVCAAVEKYKTDNPGLGTDITSKNFDATEFIEKTVYGGQGDGSYVSDVFKAGSMANGKDYKWRVMLTDNKGESITSREYFFKARSKPTVKIDQFPLLAQETRALDECIEIPGDTAHSSESVQPSGSDIVTYRTVYFPNIPTSTPIDEESIKVYIDGNIVTPSTVNIITECECYLIELYFNNSQNVLITSDIMVELNYKEIADTDMVIHNLSYVFNGSYEQAENVPILSHRWVLSHSGNIIDDTGRIFSQNLSYETDKLINNYVYSLTLECMTEDKVVSTDEITFKVELEIIERDELVELSVSQDYDKNCVQIDIGLTSLSESVNGGTYKIVRECDDEIIVCAEDKIVSRDSHISVQDFGVESPNTYVYRVYISDNANSQVFSKRCEINLNYHERWALIGLSGNRDSYVIDKDNIWFFDHNYNSSEVSYNNGKKTISVMSEYPRIVNGYSKYNTETISTYLGCIENSKYEMDDIVRLKSWKEFVSSTAPKLLSSPKGETMIVDIINPRYKVERELVEMPTKLTFDYVEIGNAKNKTICVKED